MHPAAGREKVDNIKGVEKCCTPIYTLLHVRLLMYIYSLPPSASLPGRAPKTFCGSLYPVVVVVL